MSGQRTVSAEFLADDLREIRDLLPPGIDEEEGLAGLLHDALVVYRNDEATWQRVEHKHDAPAEAARLEMKRRETAALLVSMRSRTIRSEMEMYELRDRVRSLQERHAEQRAGAEIRRRSIARLRRRIARVEEQLSGRSTPSVTAPRISALRQALAMLWRRHG